MANIREDLEGVIVAVGEDGQPVILRPGDEVPEGVKVGAHALSEGDADSDGDGGTTPAGDSDLQVPPRGGAGSGADAWRAYGVAAAKAKGLEIEIPSEASREDIIEALKGADIPVE